MLCCGVEIHEEDVDRDAGEDTGVGAQPSVILTVDIILSRLPWRQQLPW